MHGDIANSGATFADMDLAGDAEYNAENPPSMKGVILETNKDLCKSFPDACAEYGLDEFSSSSPNEEDDRMHILSQQLAKTAVSVRHMYKQLSTYHCLTMRSCSCLFERQERLDHNQGKG